MKRIVIFGVLCCMILLGVKAQNAISMGSQTSVSGCDLYIYDDGGAANGYATGTNQVLTIYSNDPSNGCVMIEIQALDVDPSDTLYIYDGADITGTLLHCNGYGIPNSRHLYGPLSARSGAAGFGSFFSHTTSGSR